MKQSPAVDRTDWLKTAAIIMVAVDHFGYFFMADDTWWIAFGRLAAPPFFFLLGYANTRKVPHHWVWLGVILTLLDSWNADWAWVAPNILLSLALIRLVRPYVQALLQRHGWIAFAPLLAGLLAAVPLAGNVVDYGAEGWLWALFGLCQRIYVDRRSATPARPPAYNAGLMRLVACVVAATAYIWQEQRDFSFPQIPLAVVVLGVGVLSLGLFLFQRGPSRVQPAGAPAAALRFIGRHTLEIYAIQLAGSELLVKLLPGLAP